MWSENHSSAQVLPFVSSRKTQWFLWELARTFCKLSSIGGALKQHLSLTVVYSKGKDGIFSAIQGWSKPASTQYSAWASSGMESGQLYHNALLIPSADGLALGRRSPTVSPPGPQQLAGSSPDLLWVAINLIDYNRPNPWAFQNFPSVSKKSLRFLITIQFISKGVQPFVHKIRALWSLSLPSLKHRAGREFSCLCLCTTLGTGGAPQSYYRVSDLWSEFRH